MSAATRAFTVLALCTTAFAAVHDYHEDYFYAVADAYIFRGGREGLFASSAEVTVKRSPRCAAKLGKKIEGCCVSRLSKSGETSGKLPLALQTGSLK